jgi:hypothetical protein
MSSKPSKKPYDPQLTSERDIQALMEKVAEEQRGQKRITRGPTEKYVCTCTDGALLITDNVFKVRDFENKHVACPPHSADEFPAQGS